jgi:hypothetical protein
MARSKAAAIDFRKKISEKYEDFLELFNKIPENCEEDFVKNTLNTYLEQKAKSITHKQELEKKKAEYFIKNAEQMPANTDEKNRFANTFFVKTAERNDNSAKVMDINVELATDEIDKVTSAVNEPEDSFGESELVFTSDKPIMTETFISPVEEAGSTLSLSFEVPVSAINNSFFEGGEYDENDEEVDSKSEEFANVMNNGMFLKRREQLPKHPERDTKNNDEQNSKISLHFGKFKKD